MEMLLYTMVLFNIHTGHMVPVTGFDTLARCNAAAEQVRQEVKTPDVRAVCLIIGPVHE